MIWVETV